MPYHYYKPRESDECATYLQNENNRRGHHHRFITEKQVFARWATLYNITFTSPKWWDLVSSCTAKKQTSTADYKFTVISKRGVTNAFIRQRWWRYGKSSVNDDDVWKCFHFWFQVLNLYGFWSTVNCGQKVYTPAAWMSSDWGLIWSIFFSQGEGTSQQTPSKFSGKYGWSHRVRIIHTSSNVYIHPL